MKNSIVIILLLTSTLAIEAIGSALLYHQNDICLFDTGFDGETEKENNESKEEKTKTKLNIRLLQTAENLTYFQNQSVFTQNIISNQISREVVTPPPEFS